MLGNPDFLLKKHSNYRRQHRLSSKERYQLLKAHNVYNQNCFFLSKFKLRVRQSYGLFN